MKKAIVLLLCLTFLFAGLPVMAEEQAYAGKSWDVNALSELPAGSADPAQARTLDGQQLKTAVTPEGAVVNQPKEVGWGWADRMFADTYVAWGFMTPQDDVTRDYKVVLEAGIYGFDDVNWEVQEDNFMEEIDPYYEGKDMIGFQFSQPDGKPIRKLWCISDEYNELETRVSPLGYQYKEITFHFTGIAPYTQGLVFMGWDEETLYMSMMLFRVTYYDAATGQKIAEVDNEDIRTGTPDNLTGIVHNVHDYTDLSCGTAVSGMQPALFLSGAGDALKAGKYLFAAEVDTKGALALVTDKENRLIASQQLATDGLQSVTVPFEAPRDGEYFLSIVQGDKVIGMKSLALAAQEMSADEKAAKAVTDELNALKDAADITEEDSGAVQQARENYDNLTDVQKELVPASALNKLTAAEQALEELSVTLGDVDNDGDINSIDSLMVLRYSVGAETLSDKQQKAADVTRDGSIDSLDALDILRYSVGIIDAF